MGTVTQLNKTQGSQAEELPALRQKEAESAAALQTQKLTLQRIEDQEKEIETFHELGSSFAIFDEFCNDLIFRCDELCIKQNPRYRNNESHKSLIADCLFLRIDIYLQLKGAFFQGKQKERRIWYPFVVRDLRCPFQTSRCLPFDVKCG